VGRSGAKALPPPHEQLREGAHVGEAVSGLARPIHFPPDLMRRHHLYVARTRMGKSTLMRHLVEHRLQEKAAGRDRDAVVVIDPHADLVAAILEQVPEQLVSEVRLIDLADERGAVGINLLDAGVFTDRDRTADAVVRVARGLWEQWGPRMQSILEQTVKTLHEANSHPATKPEEQYTILDGLKLLTDESFRSEVLTRLRDPYLLQWWANDFGKWRREYRSDALAPVQTRLNYYASSTHARAILGQSRSTVDLRRTILEGGVLLVSTAQGSVGRDVAALVGASLLNLVDSVIREQERLPQHERRGALVVVDEMQTIPGVDFESMLSELGKYGASFVLATQSLAKLDQISPSMRHTLLANVGCLAVFQVAGDDARELIWELNRERVSEEDIVSQPVHHCYVRATVGTERTPVFSMRVRKPELGAPERAAEIRKASSAYLTPAHRMEAQEMELKRQLDQYQDGADALRNSKEPKPPKPDHPPKPKREDRQAKRDGGTGE
ncbi:MAG: type IV secretion system DNA-binding domain-containing protein, partial [Chloroflexi bacterium]|nr:type IV secretion system DNA-binding domain-containing protein [Chloroflexota bacterium]